MAHQVSKRAERDLKSIAYYIATESGSVDSSERPSERVSRVELH